MSKDYVCKFVVGSVAALVMLLSLVGLKGAVPFLLRPDSPSDVVMGLFASLLGAAFLLTSTGALIGVLYKNGDDDGA